MASIREVRIKKLSRYLKYIENIDDVFFKLKKGGESEFHTVIRLIKKNPLDNEEFKLMMKVDQVQEKLRMSTKKLLVALEGELEILEKR